VRNAQIRRVWRAVKGALLRDITGSHESAAGCLSQLGVGERIGGPEKKLGGSEAWLPIAIGQLRRELDTRPATFNPF
jgi:hypothetical protein